EESYEWLTHSMQPCHPSKEAFRVEVVDQHQTALAKLLDLNVRVPALLTAHYLPKMLEDRAGGIVQMSSLGGFYPGPYQAHYYASKAYLNSFGEALKYEVAGTGVRVLTVAPGPVDTRIHTKMGSENALYRYVLPSLSTERVAMDTRRAYALGRRMVVPGIMNRLMASVSGVVPRVVLLPLLALLLRPPASRRLWQRRQDAQTVERPRETERG
ncbi:MAG: SDR family NAD(P)-dependent oxidoreductase, partial [Pseudomonadota bacterium]